MREGSRLAIMQKSPTPVNYKSTWDSFSRQTPHSGKRKRQHGKRTKTGTAVPSGVRNDKTGSQYNSSKKRAQR